MGEWVGCTDTPPPPYGYCIMEYYGVLHSYCLLLFISMITGTPYYAVLVQLSPSLPGLSMLLHCFHCYCITSITEYIRNPSCQGNLGVGTGARSRIQLPSQSTEYYSTNQGIVLAQAVPPISDGGMMSVMSYVLFLYILYGVLASKAILPVACLVCMYV